MGIHNLPLLIYGAKIEYKYIKRIEKKWNKEKEDEDDEDFCGFLEPLKILRVSPYFNIEDDECNWYYLIHKFEHSFSFEEPTMFKEINIPKYDENKVKRDLQNLGIKKYKIGFYLDVDVG